MAESIGKKKIRKWYTNMADWFTVEVIDEEI